MSKVKNLLYSPIAGHLRRGEIRRHSRDEPGDRQLLGEVQRSPRLRSQVHEGLSSRYSALRGRARGRGSRGGGGVRVSAEGSDDDGIISLFCYIH